MTQTTYHHRFAIDTLMLAGIQRGEEDPSLGGVHELLNIREVA